MNPFKVEHYVQLTFISPKHRKKKRVSDVFRAFLVDGARFTEIEQYPIIEDWMIPDIDALAEINLIPYNKLDEVDRIENYYICFYCRDKDFTKILRNPRKYTRLFRRAKGIIGFDYSVYEDMPIVKQKAQMNDNLSLTFFYGMRNIPVIPNIRYGSPPTRDDFLSAIPKGTVISIGSYGCVRSAVEKRAFREFLEEMLPILDPKVIIVYGAMPADVFEPFEDRHTFIQCPAFIEEEMKEVG